ncbi:hypothetical protein JXA59_00995 [Patescibacteria group bacterium]|nr:hypothetical protein [Patescibacteria group bacterium]
MSGKVVQNDKDKLLLWFYAFVGRYVDPHITRGEATLQRIELLKKLCQLWKDKQLEEEMAWVRSSTEEPGPFLAERLLGAVWSVPMVIHSAWSAFFAGHVKNPIPPLPCSAEEVKEAVQRWNLFPIYVPPEWAEALPQSVESFRVLADRFGFMDAIHHYVVEANQFSIAKWDKMPPDVGWFWTEASLRFPERLRPQIPSVESTVYPTGAYPSKPWRPMSLFPYVIFSRFVQWASDMTMCPDASPISFTLLPNVKIKYLGSDTSWGLTLSWEYSDFHRNYFLREGATYHLNSQHGGYRSLLPIK